MRYGFCTGFAASVLFGLGTELLPRIKDAGFDFVEFPLMSVAELDESGFRSLRKSVRDSGLGCEASCNLFPGSLSLYADSDERLRRYLKFAVGRAGTLGMRKIVFGSGAFRSYPSSMPYDEAYGRLVFFCREVVAPAAELCGIPILVEPMNTGECNMVNTIADGAALVRAVDNPFFGLMADLYHMSVNAEDPAILGTQIGHIQHVHLCNHDRLLPTVELDPYVSECLGVLKGSGYDGSVSYESKDDPGMPESLDLLRRVLPDLPPECAR